MGKEEKVIRSENIYQDVAVEIQIGEKSDLDKEGDTVLFVRPATPAVLKAISAFNCGLPINALLYSQTLKRRRGEMLALKNGGRR